MISLILWVRGNILPGGFLLPHRAFKIPFLGPPQVLVHLTALLFFIRCVFFAEPAAQVWAEGPNFARRCVI